MANTEIEIRVRVEDSSPLINFLEKNGSFKSEKWQKDEYFTPAHRNFIEAKPIKEWLRLREEEDKCSLAYKNWHYGSDGKAYHCDEYEIGIGDAGQARNILEALNFNPVIVVDKKRKIFTFEDYEVALDSVNELGGFVEVEYKGENQSDIKKISDEMRDFIEKTGCRILEQDFTGYPALLLKKKFGLSLE